MSSTEDTAEEPFLATESIPDELQDKSRWVCWKAADSDGKKAVDPHSGEPLSSLSEGATLDNAERELDTSNHDGLAFVILEEHDYMGIRLIDAVRELSDDLDTEEWAENLIRNVDSYTEIGPVGNDILLLAKGTIPDEKFESEKVRLVSEGVVPITGRYLTEYPAIHNRQEEVNTVFTGYNQHKTPEEDDQSAEFEENVTLSEVRETVVKNFDEAQWHLTKAILSTHATLLISGIQNCAGLIVVGQSGAGKTTALKFFEGLEEQFYRSDEITPASFVSHDASQTDEELEEVDLLPRIKHKSLLCHDMETWFSGDRENIRETMARMTHLMDGEGLTRDSGSHGKRGYEGDFRFSFIGASTPLASRAWDVMGNAGYRFVFYHKEPRPDDEETLKNNLFGESSYGEKVDECRQKVQSFLHRLWNENGGYGSVPDNEISFSDDAQNAIPYLAQVVKFSRATLTDRSDEENPIVNREDPHRIGAVLRDIAKGRALLDGETRVTVDDVIVSARIALSAMPNKRRSLVRELLNPSNGGQLTRKEAQDALGVSKPTALNRMKLINSLDIAKLSNIDNDGRGTKKLVLRDEFIWPDSLHFPDKTNNSRPSDP